MRPALICLLSFVLGACALPPGAEPRPERVSLGGTRMTVSFADGIRCLAEVPLTGGSGQPVELRPSA